MPIKPEPDTTQPASAEEILKGGMKIRDAIEALRKAEESTKQKDKISTTKQKHDEGAVMRIVTSTGNDIAKAYRIAAGFEQEGIEAEVREIPASILDTVLAKRDGHQAYTRQAVFVPKDRWMEAMAIHERGQAVINVITGETTREGRW